MIPRGKIKDKRKAILESSLELIAQQGFHGASMKQIAENAKVAAGTIYVYFANKDELIHELFVQIRTELNNLTVDSYDSTISFKENFMIIWNKVLDYYLHNPLKYNFVEQFTSSPFINDVIVEEGSKALAPAFSIFDEARVSGKLINLPTHALIALSYGPILSLVKMNILGEIEIEKQIDREKFAEASWNSISA